MTMDASTVAPLILHAVTKTWRGAGAPVAALRGISLRIEPGSFTAVMGPSGSGKGTLLHVASGLTAVDSGYVELAGADLGVMSDAALTRHRRRYLGVVFQSFNLVPTLDALANVALPLTLDGRSSHEAHAKAAAMLERVGLAARMSHVGDQLSGGEQQRVALARALVHDPALILADEPTGNLDRVTAQTVGELFRQLHRDERRTMVIVTHEPEVAAWAERLVVLADGAIRTDEPINGMDAADVAARYVAAVRAGAAS